MDVPGLDTELFDVLHAWEGYNVAVRVVATAEDELIGVFSGRLQSRSDEKHPAVFWPLESTGAPSVERPGIYVHPGSYKGARIHEDDFVVEFEQAGVTTNIRRLDRNIC